jgi:hypothetical protein
MAPAASRADFPARLARRRSGGRARFASVVTNDSGPRIAAAKLTGICRRPARTPGRAR